MAVFKKLEEIEVWKRACRLAVEIYRLCEIEPLSKDWGLKDQLRRTAVSIASNIAEGYERNSRAEFRRYLVIAKGSCGELKTQLYILKAIEKLPAADVEKLLKEVIEISSMIGGLASSISQKIDQ
jgi:four helix bundle protein